MKKKLLSALLLCLVAVVCMFMFSCHKDDEQVEQQFKITLNPADGSSSTVATVNKDEVFKLTVPEREGYSFEGWYTSADYSGSAVTEITAKEDIAVYAKWEKLYTLTLDTKGGTLTTATFQLKAGDNIYSAISAAAPTKDNCTFGEWLLNGEKITESSVMPANNLTLTASYKIKYTVELYLQNAALNGYDKSDNIVTEYAYIGETVTAKQTVPGYTEIKTSDSITSLTISDVLSDNVFKCYFNRAEYILTFVSNFPDGSQNQTKTSTMVFGIETPLPFVTFDMEGYYLEGWALSADGDMVYSSHLMDDKLFNGTNAEVKNISLTADTALYAVWCKGYTDLFKGGDTIYVSNGEENTIYMERGGLFFKGKLRDTNGLRFYDVETGDILYSGQLNADGNTFLYNDDARAEMFATLYEMGVGLNENIKIYFDNADGITYSLKKDDGTTSDSNGTYVFDESGYYIVTYTSGELSGTTMTLVSGKMTVGGQTVPAFQVRNEEEFNMGKILSFIIDGDSVIVNVDSDGNTYADITLNGFGIASFNKGTSTQSYYYTFDKDKQLITLTSSSGSVAGVLSLMTINGELGYMLYDEEKDVDYTLADNSVLSLDGISKATYTNGTTVVSGFYTTKTSKFGGTILSFVCNGTTYNFMLTTKQEGIINPENPEETITTTVTVAEQLGHYYAEYTFDVYSDNGTLRTNLTPLIVFDGADKTTVSIYGYTTSRTYLKIANGTVVYNAATETYTLTVTERITIAEELSPSSVDFSTVKSAVMMLYDRYFVHFWLEYEKLDGTRIETATSVYTNANNPDLTVTLFPVIAVYNNDGVIEIATYAIEDGIATLTFADRTESITFDDSAKTFVDVVPPETFTEVGKDGNIIKTQYITISRDGIVYSINTVVGESQVLKQYPGKFSSTGKTSLTGFTIYKYESDEKKPASEEPLYSFEFIALTNNYFFTYDEAYYGSYTSSTGVLNLDGFGFAATYGDNSGKEITGMYIKDGDNVQITASSVTYNFHLDGTTFALRGDEYGKTYVVVDNQVAQNLFVKLDGIGNAVVSKVVTESGTSTQQSVDENATYTLNGTDITVTYKDGADTHTLVCKVGTFSTSATVYNALNITHDEVVSKYINNEDWSVLILNNDGTATKHLKDGSVETGSYSIITNSLLYYVNDEATDAFIYVYNHDTAIATPQDYEICAYYTKDLDSLLFSQYGFAIFNGATRYYYTVENDNVTIYHHDVEDASRNEYDYVKEEFGRFDDTKVYNEKTYYKNDGYAVSFERLAATASKYPVAKDENDNKISVSSLVFTPGSSQEFSVTGAVTVGSTNYSCKVVRELDDEGNVSLYFTIGALYFDIAVNYQGETGSTYEVTGLTSNKTLPAYNYLYYYYYIYTMLGSSYASQVKNDFGVIQAVIVYNDEGVSTESYLNASFGKSSKLYDANGDLIESIEKADMISMNNAYMANFTAADGYEYTLLLTINTSTASSFGTNSYVIYGLVRNQSLTTSNGYTVEVGRIVASDSASNKGGLFTINLKQGETELNNSTALLYQNSIYYVVKDTDDSGNITATTYYKIDLVEKDDSGLGEGSEDLDLIPVYESATVTAISATTYKTADGKDYVDVLSTGKIMIISVDGNDVLISDTVYDSVSGIYTLTATDGKTYTVTIVTNVATITLVSTPEA